MSTFGDDVRYPVAALAQPGDTALDPVSHQGPRYFDAPSSAANEVTTLVNAWVPGQIIPVNAWQEIWQTGARRLAAYANIYGDVESDTRPTATFVLVGLAGLPWTGVGGMTMLRNIGK